MAVEDAGQVRVGRLGGVPCQSSVVEQRRIHCGPGLVVPVVAPSGEEATQGVMFFGVFDGGADVVEGVGEASVEAVPGGGAWGDEVIQSAFGHLAALFGEGVVAFVAPDDGHGVLGYVIYIVRAFQKYIAPEEHGASTGFHEVVNLLEEIDVDGVFTTSFDLGATPALSKLPRFV